MLLLSINRHFLTSILDAIALNFWKSGVLLLEVTLLQGGRDFSIVDINYR